MIFAVLSCVLVGKRSTLSYFRVFSFQIDEIFFSLFEVFIAYELSPFMVEKREKAVPLTHFLASTVAILGGVFSVAVLVNGLLLAAFPTKNGSGALC